MTAQPCIVYVVDDDPGVRESLENLLSSYGLNVLTFGCAADYKALPQPDAAACLVLDVDLPDMSGLELQSELAGGEHPPIIFITGCGDIPSSVRAIKAGAIDFLPKPFSPEKLLSAIRSAIEQHRDARSLRAELVELKGRYESLTPREREVLPLVARGLLNKQAAAELGISEITLQIHRRHIMQKMAAASFADLVRMSVKLGIAAGGSMAAALLIA